MSNINYNTSIVGKFVDNKVFIREEKHIIDTLFNPLQIIEVEISIIHNKSYTNIIMVTAIINCILGLGMTYFNTPYMNIVNFLVVIIAGLSGLVSGLLFGSLFSSISELIPKKSIKILENKKKIILNNIEEQLKNIEIQKEILLYINNLENNQYAFTYKEYLEKFRKNLMVAFYDKDYVKAQQIMLEENYLFKATNRKIKENMEEEEKIHSYSNNVDIDFQNNDKSFNEKEQTINDYRKMV